MKPTRKGAKDLLRRTNIHNTKTRKIPLHEVEPDYDIHLAITLVLPKQSWKTVSDRHYDAEVTARCGNSGKYLEVNTDNETCYNPSNDESIGVGPYIKLDQIPPVNDRNKGWISKLMPRQHGRFVKLKRTKLPLGIRKELEKRCKRKYTGYKRTPNKDDDGNELEPRVTRSKSLKLLQN
ncbi:unnamed protein product [Allacma fusca]|uniref:Uncharacterized protein n=1 Tax=Allacma fusca TaxID=39272 RepID=A0A8J2KLI4_9HEXA|nr:unnamed protein product [Allacma fusca]